MIEEKVGEDQLKILNIIKNWPEKIEKNFRLEKSINWEIAIVKK